MNEGGLDYINGSKLAGKLEIILLGILELGKV